MKILVLSADYPNLNQGRANQFVHTRNLVYLKQNIEVEVLNFACLEAYVIDNIPVNPMSAYQDKTLQEFDIVVAHAANIRNHYKFLSKKMQQIKHLVFFYHGHEVMKISKDYAPDYDFVKQKNIVKRIIQDVYDEFKFKLWRKFILKYQEKVSLVFVSQWMQNTFLRNLKLKAKHIEEFSHIIYNPVGNVFQVKDYTVTQRKFDFVTIRSNLDGAKYCVDVVNKLAYDNLDYSFLVVGKGEYFKHHKPALNITWLDQTLSHQEILETLNQCGCGLFLTRTDAQGVMACEVATLGMPLIVSDIEVMHEVFDSFSNVMYINNELALQKEIKLKDLIPSPSLIKNKKYFEENTTYKEIELFQSILENQGEII